MSISVIRFEPAATLEQALDRAAEWWGIQPEYEDTWGERHVTPPEVQQAVLAALGVPAGSREQLDEAVEERLWQDWNGLLPPVVVRDQAFREMPLTVPWEWTGGTAGLEVRLEDGGIRRWEASLDGLETSTWAELRGRTFVRKQLPLPEDLPLGYHDVTVELEREGAPAITGAARLILCPERAYTPRVLRDGGRTAGLAIALYGVRSARNWGCGDFTDLERLIDWLAEAVGASFVGLNPLHDIPNRRPFNLSPYLPATAFYKNPIYLDLERVEEFHRSPRARAWLARPEIQAEIEELRQAELAEYERVHALKLRALRLAFPVFLRQLWRDSPRAAQFREFVAREGELLDRYATYCVLDLWIRARHPGVWVWPDWPEPYRDPDSAAVQRFARRHWRTVLFFKWIQWQVDLQLAAAQEHARRRGLAIGLYHDLALATDRCGADFWAYRSFYVSGCRVGAPPDGFAPKGQDWAFPPPDADRHRQDGYRLLVESVRHNLRHGGALRIDHVMRFFRLYWIPEGLDPAQGAYVQGDWQDLLRILALESVRHRVAIIGEDLGTVTAEIRRTLDQFGIIGYQVPYFEKQPSGEFRAPSQYRPSALVSSSTHDLPTLAGYWVGRDIEARRAAGLLPDEASYERQLSDRAADKQQLLTLLLRLGLLPEGFPRRADQAPELTGELHNAVVGLMALTPCRLMALNQEDLFKETEQQNLPASTWQYPNWQRKMKYSLEALRASPAREFTRMLRAWLERSGRLP
ncbi:MAG: 4-alpha-glucanotransferase, partial [Acidobacteria bacterium]|nr:4-alpha-glucanotransferase [Acidobacteriota bacterium]